MEEWRSIKGFLNYEISSLGRIRSKVRTKEWKILKLRANNHGYGTTELGKRNKFAVHRLVGMTFLHDSFFEGAVINHINGIKNDNRIENLEWCTQSHNAKHSFKIGTSSIVGERHPSSKLTDQTVIEIRNKRKLGFKCKDLAKVYNVHPSTISSACCRYNWTHL